MTIGELKKIVQKELGFKGDHVPYAVYSDLLTIANCKNDFLKSEFEEWDDTPCFLPALFNLCCRLPKGVTVEQLKKHLKDIEHKYPFDANYFDASDEYYVEKVKGDNVWRECIVSVNKIKGNENTDNCVSLSKLRDYLLDNPNIHCCSVLCYVDKKTLKELLKSGLVYKPSREEKKWM